MPVLLRAPPLLIPDSWGEHGRREQSISPSPPLFRKGRVVAGRAVPEGSWQAADSAHPGLHPQAPTALGSTVHHGAGAPQTFGELGVRLWPALSEAGGPLSGLLC